MTAGPMTRATVAAATVAATSALLPAAADVAPQEPIPGHVLIVAGTGVQGSSPDGTPVLEAEFHDVISIAVAPDGTVYLVDRSREKVRTVGADGLLGSVPELSGSESADGEDSTLVWAVAAGEDGSVYSATEDGIRVLRPDGQAEMLAAGQFAQDIAVGADGTVYATDQANGLVRAVDPSGAVTTLAGEGGSVVDPRSIAVDSSGVVYVADSADSYDDEPAVVRRIDRDGSVSTVVGKRPAGFAGDSGPAVDAAVSDRLGGLAVGPDGTLHVVDIGNRVLRAIDPDGIITTVEPAFASTGIWPVSAPELPDVEDVAFGPDGTLHVAVGATIRTITPGSAASIVGDGGSETGGAGDDLWADEEAGTVVTVAGPNDLPSPEKVVVDAEGVAYVVTKTEGAHHGLVRIGADGTPQPVSIGSDNDRPLDVRAVVPGRDGALHLSTNFGIHTRYPDGTMVHLAGGIAGEQSFADGVPATMISMSNWDLTLGPGGLYLPDAVANAVYVLAPDGTMGMAGASVDGYPRSGIDVDDDGTVYVAENTQHQVTMIDPDGTSTVVAGNGESSWSNDEMGDGGPATDAVLANPTDVVVDADGTLYVSSSHGIHRIDDDGVITTVRDRTEEGEANEGRVTSLDFDPHGNLYFTEPTAGLVQVLVRPRDISEPFPWALVLGGGIGVVVLGVGGLLLVRRRRVDAERQEETAVSLSS